MVIQNLSRFCVTLGICLFLTGCGGVSDAPETVAVSGGVTYQGKGVPKLSVAFIPDGEKGLLASATTDDAGKFELMTNQPGDGAKVGVYKVAISFVPDEIPEMPGLPGTESQAPVSPIPAKYADAATSGLTATVDKDASKNKFTFELTD